MTDPKLPSQRKKPGPTRQLLDSVRSTVIMERSIYEKVKELADARGRTFSKFAAELLEQAVKEANLLPS